MLGASVNKMLLLPAVAAAGMLRLADGDMLSSSHQYSQCHFSTSIVACQSDGISSNFAPKHSIRGPLL